MGSEWALLSIFVRHDICQLLRGGIRGYNHTVTVVCGSTEALSVRGVRSSALLHGGPFLLYHHPYSPSFSRFYSNIAPLIGYRGCSTSSYSFSVAPRLAGMTRHVPNRKGVGAELSGLYVFPPHPSITRRETGVLDAKAPLRPSLTLTTGIFSFVVSSQPDLGKRSM